LLQPVRLPAGNEPRLRKWDSTSKVLSHFDSPPPDDKEPPLRRKSETLVQILTRCPRGKTQVVAIGHNIGMSKMYPARKNDIPIMAVTDLLEVLERW